MIAQAIQMGVQGARGVANKAQEKRERDNLHKTAMNKRQYVDWEGRELGPEVTDYDGNLVPELRHQLTIPEMQFDGKSPTACFLTHQQVSDLDRQILAAQELLGQAALTINKAESKAGFAANAGTIAMGGVRGAMPLTSFIAMGISLDAQSARAGLKVMQEAEQMLQMFSQHLHSILQQLSGAVSIAPAKQPLALTALLSAMAPGGNVSLASTQHPAIQVLYRSDKAQDAAGAGAGGIGGKLMNRGAKRDDKKQKQPGLLRTTLHGTLHFARQTDRGMTSEQVQDRQVAVKMAHQVCIADKLEFLRLTEQTEKLRSWLVAKPYQPLSQQSIMQ